MSTKIFFLKDEKCDASIVCEKHQLMVNKAILSVYSPIFEKLFESENTYIYDLQPDPLISVLNLIFHTGTFSMDPSSISIEHFLHMFNCCEWMCLDMSLMNIMKNNFEKKVSSIRKIDRESVDFLVAFFEKYFDKYKFSDTCIHSVVMCVRALRYHDILGLDDLSYAQYLAAISEKFRKKLVSELVKEEIKEIKEKQLYWIVVYTSLI
jgi:hypothetical protein